MRRRGFIAGAGAGVFVACRCHSPALAADTPAEPRRVSLGGRRVPVCDFHAHCLIPAVAEVLRGSDLHPPLPALLVVTQDRIAAMDRRGIDMQLLSVHRYWWYAAGRDLAARIVRVQDEGVAALCRAHPDRFVGLSSPALQFPDLAAEQLDYAVNTLGLRGASVGGQAGGEVPSSAKFDPFWARAEALGVPVFMHPNEAPAIVREGALAGRGDLGNVIGDPLETTLFLSRLIFDGTLDRFPKLRVVAAHGGGYLPSYAGRTNVACEVRAAAHCANTRQPVDYLQTRIHADTLVFSEEGLRHLVAEMGASQVVYGSDMPFNWPDTVDIVLNQTTIGDSEKAAILGGNFQRLLKLV